MLVGREGNVSLHMTLESAKFFDLLGLGLGDNSVLGFFFSFEII